MTNLSLTSLCPRTRGQSVVGVRGQSGSEVCGWIWGSVCSWDQKSVCGQFKSVYGLVQGSVCDKEQESVCIQIKTLSIPRVKDQLGQGQSSVMVRVGVYVCGMKLPTKLHQPKSNLRPRLGQNIRCSKHQASVLSGTMKGRGDKPVPSIPHGSLKKSRQPSPKPPHCSNSLGNLVDLILIYSYLTDGETESKKVRTCILNECHTVDEGPTSTRAQPPQQPEIS